MEKKIRTYIYLFTLGLARKDQSAIFLVILFLFAGLMGSIALVSYYNLNPTYSAVHICPIILFLFSQKDKITIKKLTNLSIIVFITPLVLYLIIFSIPYLVDISLVIYLDFCHPMHRILAFFISKVYEVLLKIFSKKGFIDFLTNLCILYVIKLVFLGSLCVFDIISNIFFTNCLFSLTIDFYSITLMKLVTPYVEKLYTSIINPIFIKKIHWCFHTIHCYSPQEATKLFNELPFANLDSNDMVEECRTSTNNKSRENLREEFKVFRKKISVFTPSFSVSTESGPESSLTIDEPSRGQLDKGKKRAIDNTQEETYNKRAKIDRGNTNSTTVTLADFEGEGWNLHSIYEKINNLMEDPKYNRHWTINKLFDSKEVQSQFYRYIEDYPLTAHKDVWHTPLGHLKSNIEEVLKTDYDENSIKQEDFLDNGLNLPLLYEKLSKIMDNKDFNKKSKIGKLTFEPFNLKSPFYAKLEALNFTNKEVSGLYISSLRNKIANRLFTVMHKPSSISWDDFTSDGLNLESIHKKIKQYVVDGQYGKRDTINRLFLPHSNIAKSFYVKLQTLNLTNITDVGKIGGIRIQTLLNSIEKVVDIPSTEDNCITREDLIGEDWNLHSIYEKITNITRTNNFNKKSKIGKLKFEPPILRKEFYNYIKTFGLTKAKTSSTTNLIALQNNLKKELEIVND